MNREMQSKGKGKKKIISKRGWWSNGGEDEDESKHGDLIYFCVMIEKVDDPNNYTYRHEWYVLERSKNNQPLRFTKEEDLSKHILPQYFLSTVQGQEIYFLCYLDEANVLSGAEPESYQCSKEVRIYHTGKREWRNGESMLLARSGPMVASLPGRIYVFDPCFYEENVKQPWAEYYDCYSKKWYPVPNVPFPTEDGFWEINMCTVITQARIIVLWSSENYFYFFNVDEDSWSFMGPHDSLDGYSYFRHPTAATLGNVQYWFYGDSLFAYDFSAGNKKKNDNTVRGTPVYTFENVWDGPKFLGTDSTLIIDSWNSEDKACLIWFEEAAEALIYTSFELIEEEEEQRKSVKWSGRYHTLDLMNTNEETHSPIYGCFQVARSSSKNDQEPRYEQSVSTHCQELDFRVLDFYDTMFKEIVACHADRDIREKELRRKVLQSVKNSQQQQDDQECDESIEEFLHKHELQELMDMFKVKNVDLGELKAKGEWCLTNFKMTRLLRIKLAMAFGWAWELSELYHDRHTF